MPHMFLNGGGMRGGSLHHLLAGAPLVAETSTAPRYLLYSVGDRYPALQPCGKDAGVGAAIADEGVRLAARPAARRSSAGRAIRTRARVIELADGSAALGMILRQPCPVMANLTDITAFGGWRAYLSRPR